MNANTLRRLNWLWKHRHTHDGETTKQQIQIIRSTVESHVDDIAVAGRGGAPEVIVAPADGVGQDTADVILTGVDDNEVIQDLLEHHQWIHIMAGTVHFSDFVRPHANVKITGAGMHATRIVASGTNDLFRIGSQLVGEEESNNRRLEISDIWLDGDGTGEIGIHLRQAANGRISASRVHFSGLAVGIRFGRPTTRDNHVTNCLFAENIRDWDIEGLLEWGGLFTANTLRGPGIFLASDGPTLWANNRIHGNVDRAGVVQNAHNSVWVGNWIDGDFSIGNPGSTNNLAVGNRVAGSFAISGWSAHNVVGGVIEDGDHGKQSRVNTFARSGVLTTLVGTHKFVFPMDATLISVRAAVGSPPVGSDLIIDINRNGPTTVFTTQANRPRVADGEVVGALATPNVTAMSAGDWLTVDIDQIGSTDPGEDLSVIVEWEIT